MVLQLEVLIQEHSNFENVHAAAQVSNLRTFLQSVFSFLCSPRFEVI
jgi:hypothetical protein